MSTPTLAFAKLSRVALALAVSLSVLTGACTLDRVGVRAPNCDDSSLCGPDEVCVDGRCVSSPDAGRADAAVDGGADASRDATPTDTGVDAPPDAGAAHCSNGVIDVDESDVDCGGACRACESCEICNAATDCGTGECLEGRCAAQLSAIVTPGGLSIPAFVRDGAVLLAHYAPGSYHRDYDPRTSQRMDASGGTTPLDGWAPDPCRESGHLAFTSVVPAGRVIRLECGPEIGRPSASVSAEIFDSFDLGDHGPVGATGSPGWANLSAVGTGRGRTSYGSCGSGLSVSTGGVGYCDGASTTYATHLVSYTVFTGGGNPYVGCAREGCNGPSCPTHVWVWADLP